MKIMLSLQASPEPLDCGEFARFYQTSWLFWQQSGTTGEPKWFAHSFSSLVNYDIKQSENLQNGAGAYSIKPFRFCGLQGVLKPC